VAGQVKKPAPWRCETKGVQPRLEGGTIVSADVWFRRDIANALLATYQAARETSCTVGSEDRARVALFHAGYRSAISTMALFFGISPALVLPDEPAAYRGMPQRPGLDEGEE